MWFEHMLPMKNSRKVIWKTGAETKRKKGHQTGIGMENLPKLYNLKRIGGGKRKCLQGTVKLEKFIP